MSAVGAGGGVEVKVNTGTSTGQISAKVAVGAGEDVSVKVNTGTSTGQISVKVTEQAKSDVGAGQTCGTKKAGVLVIYNDKNGKYVLVGTQGGYLEDLDVKNGNSENGKIKIDKNEYSIWDWQSFNAENNSEMFKQANLQFSKIAKEMSKIPVLGLKEPTRIQFSTPEYGPKKTGVKDGKGVYDKTKQRWNTKFHRLSECNQKLSIPRGGVKDNETCLQAALREFQEEVGYEELRKTGKLNELNPKIVLKDTTVFLVELQENSNTKKYIETTINNQKEDYLGEFFDAGFAKINGQLKSNCNALTNLAIDAYEKGKFTSVQEVCDVKLGKRERSGDTGEENNTKKPKGGGRHTRRKKSFRKKTLHKKH